MRLAKLSEFRRLIDTSESAPTFNTLRARIRDIPGGTIQWGRYYVDLDEYDRVKGIRAEIAVGQARMAKNSLLERLI
jgi:hypothetical protein